MPNLCARAGKRTSRSTPWGETLERLVQYALYALAAVIGIALLIGIYSILGWLGITLLIVGCLFVWAIKWSWLFFLK